MMSKILRLGEPFRVVANLGAFTIKDFVNLLEIGGGIFAHLFASQRRAHFGTAGGIADHGGDIANQENGGVAFVLKVLELAQDYGVAEVQIGRGGVYAELDAEGLGRKHGSARAWRATPLHG